MTRYIISFPSEAMVFPAEDLPEVARAAHAALDEIKAAGAYVFGGGLNEDVAPVRVTADGAVKDGPYPQTEGLWGGFTIVDVATRDEALMWAAKIADACRCDQEVREFQYDPES